MLHDINEWPISADDTRYICLKRGDEHGFIIEGSWEVNLGYILDGGDGRFIQYESADAILADGWIVD